MTDQAPENRIEPAPGFKNGRVSVVWLVPLTALVIALGIAWQSYRDRGPLILISFESAAGMTAGETRLRYRDVEVGVVEDLSFSPDLGNVRAVVRLDKSIAPFVDDDARFWIVEPEVTTRGVRGLNTVLSGVYIEGTWDAVAEGLVPAHFGLDEPPLADGGQRGLTILLSAQPGSSLSASTPILYNGIEVGRVGKPRLIPSIGTAQAEAIIYAPYDQLVTSATRFWDTSGFTVSIGATGAAIDFESISSLIAGGITFETILGGGTPVEAGYEFLLHADENQARASLISAGEGPVLNVTTVFLENYSGLTVGAPVELDGVSIGEVSGIGGVIDEERFGDSRVRMLATLTLRPSRLGLEGLDRSTGLDFLDLRIRQGLRTRLASASLLTGGLKIEMVKVPDVEDAVLDRDAEPYPIVPSTISNISDVSATAEGVLERINALPIEELLVSATRLMDSATTVVASEDVEALPGDARELIVGLGELLKSEEVQALPSEIAVLVADLQDVTGNLQDVTGSLARADLVGRLDAAILQATDAIDAVESGTEGFEDLIANLNIVAENAANLPLETLVEELTTAVAATRAVLTAPSTREIPDALNGALGEIEAALSELRQGGIVDNLNTTLAAAGASALAVEDATKRLPEIAERLDAVLAQATETLAGFGPSSELSREAREALRDIQNASEAVESLSRALERRPNSVLIGR